MSILSDLEAALGAKQEAWAAFTAYTHGADQRTLLDEYDIACSRYKAILTDDNIAALIAVARAAEAAAPFIGGWVGHVEASEMLDAALAPLVKEADCPTCHGHGGGGGFDRNGSHTEGRYCEYPCPMCGKEADHE